MSQEAADVTDDRVGRPDDPNDKREKTASIEVFAPSNAAHILTIKTHDRADKVARESVEYFVSVHQMDNLACTLVLIDDGVATLLDDTLRLDEIDVRDGTKFRLQVKKPKVDGNGEQRTRKSAA